LKFHIEMNIQLYQPQNLMRSRACFIKGGLPYLSLSCKITRMLEYAITSFAVKRNVKLGSMTSNELFLAPQASMPPSPQEVLDSSLTLGNQEKKITSRA